MSIRLTETRLRSIIREEIKGMGRRGRLQESGAPKWWKSLASTRKEAENEIPGMNTIYRYHREMMDAMKAAGMQLPPIAAQVASDYTAATPAMRAQLTREFDKIYMDHADELEAAWDKKWTDYEASRSASLPSSAGTRGGALAQVKGTPAEKMALKKIAKWFSVYGWYKYQATPGKVSPDDVYTAAYEQFDLPPTLYDVVGYGDNVDVDGAAVLLMQRLGIDITPFTSLPDEGDWDERMGYGQDYQDELGGYVKNKFLKRRDASGMTVKTRIR